MRASLAVVGLVALSACGNPGSFSGKVSGQTLNVKSSAFASVSNIALPGQTAALGTIEGAAVILSSVKDICADVTAKQEHRSQGYLILGIGKAGAGNGSITTGSYPVVDTSDESSVVNKAISGFGFGNLDVEDGSCNNTLKASSAGTATSGSIALNGITTGSSGSADGTFQLSMGPQNDPISGSFSANYCPALEALLQTMVASIVSGSTTGSTSSTDSTGSTGSNATATSFPCS